jgi:uncharacterized ferritin-like protein (DUF455 family)
VCSDVCLDAVVRLTKNKKTKTRKQKQENKNKKTKTRKQKQENKNKKTKTRKQKQEPVKPNKLEQSGGGTLEGSHVQLHKIK